MTLAHPASRTVGDLLRDLGDVPAGRVLLWPTPGKATEQDLLHLLEHEGRACELVDGTLVEKPRRAGVDFRPRGADGGGVRFGRCSVKGIEPRGSARWRARPARVRP